MPGSLGLVVEIPQVLVPRMFNVLVLWSIPFDKPPLIETLASADSKLHYASALALGKIGYSWELAKHLKPKQPNKEVLKAIGELAEKGAVFMNILTSLPTADAIPVLQNLGRNAVHQLVSIMKGRPKHQNGKGTMMATHRANAARLLGHMPRSAFDVSHCREASRGFCQADSVL
jgi:hypothetical protein